MNEKQIEFLGKFMDDYQKNKFHYLVKNKEINGVMDLYATKETYRNIEDTIKENENIVNLMNSFNEMNERPIVKNIAAKLREKKELTNNIDTFVEENIAELKAEYKRKISESKNIFINSDTINIKMKVDDGKEHLAKFAKRKNMIIKISYGLVLSLILYKVFF